MFYYKNKVKAIGVIVAIALLLAVTVSFCLWDDTSIKNLSAGANTADFTGKLPFSNGDYNTVINGVGYTVANQGTTASGQKYVTLLSDDIGLKGDKAKWNQTSLTHNCSPTAYNTHSTIAGYIQTYYSSIASKDVMYNGASVGTLSSMILGHQDGNWSMWLPSAREMQFSDIGALPSYDSGKQPIMTYYSVNALKEYGGTWYWLRSPHSLHVSTASTVTTGGSLNNTFLYNTAGAVRVALNLKI